LIDAIQQGQCVAFVGAGFSAEVVPSWTRLLLKVAGDRPGDAADCARRLLNASAPSAHELEAAAQMLMESLGRDKFRARLSRHLSDPPTPRMSERLELLRGIPFRAVLTTNFDPILKGTVPKPETYDRVLRPRNHRWWDGQYWREGRPGAHVVKLHGDIQAEDSGVVLCTREYRDRLYSNPAYMTFLRSVFATNTVPYLGFSFTDAYLNELRSEVLSLIDHGPDCAPIAYAVMSDIDPSLAKHFDAHEGIKVLPYDTKGRTDFSGFDHYLAAIHDKTNPVRHLGRLLQRKRILWLDAHPANNHRGMVFLREAAKTASVVGPPGATLGCDIEQVTHWSNAVAKLAAGKQGRADLVITHWGAGHGGDSSSVAEELLLKMRHDDLFAPVIVFASHKSVQAHRARALAMGARACVHRWEDLFQEIARLFETQP
jgi:SIR2-like domain